LSHSRLKLLAVEIRQAKGRFIEGRPPSTELVERGFTEEELVEFLAAVDDDKYTTIFTLMAALGLRASEVAALRGRDLEGDQLRIMSRKGGFGAMVRLPSSLLSLFPACGPQELIFGVTSWGLRLKFNHWRKKAGLDEVYLHTKPCGAGMGPRPCYRLSLHSLRHYAIQKFCRLSRDPDLTRRFARHRHQETTERYLQKTRKEEVELVLEGMAEPSIKKIPALGVQYGDS
jgi:integrase